jgi:hypothetical protein
MQFARSEGFGSIPSATGGIARLACARLGEMGVAMLVTLHVWFNVLRIPLEMPSPSLFAAPRGGPPPLWIGAGEKPKDGWTVWYLPVLVTAFVASVILARLTRRRERWSVLSMTLAGCVTVLIGATVACWAEHNGYMWYFRPEMTPRLLLNVQGKLVMTSLGEGLAVLIKQWPVLLIGSAAGAVCALAVGAPLRREAVAPASAPPRTEPLDDSADLTARIVSTIVLMIASQLGHNLGHPYVLLATGCCISLAWFTIAFPRVEFSFKRLLLGSLVAAMVSAFIQSWILSHSGFAATFKGNPYGSHILFVTNVRNFLMLFIINLLGLTKRWLRREANSLPMRYTNSLPFRQL